MFELEGIDHVALAVRDVEGSAKWYIENLGFERRYEGMWDGIPVFIGKGRAAIALFPSANKNPKVPTRYGILHFAFGTDRRNFLAAQEELTSRGIAFQFQDHEISHSIYFSDPDGREIEITTYELP
jgi:catechol-2,3-dioxygenase